MMHLPRRLAVSLAVVLLVATAAVTTSARPQDPEKGGVAKKKYDASRRVPPYFGQIALSGEQREQIYKARRAHLDKIEALKKEIEKHETEMMSECEAVLTETQKKLLDNLRRSGTGSTSKATSEPTKPSAAPKPK